VTSHTSGLGDDSLHVLNLSLATGEGTEPLLGELTSSLVLSVSQKFDDTTLIGGKTDNLAGDVTDEGSAAGRLALGAADPGLGGVERGGFLSMGTQVSFTDCSLFLINQGRMLPIDFCQVGPNKFDGYVRCRSISSISIRNYAF
jgi:hypothetical protein